MRSMEQIRMFARQIPYARAVWRALKHIRLRAFSLLSGRLESSVAAELAKGLTKEMHGLEGYQVAALKQMPVYSIPEPFKALSALPEHVKSVFESDSLPAGIINSLSKTPITELSQNDFEKLLAAHARQRELPVDIFAALLAAGKLDNPGNVLQLMHTYWRRLAYYSDVRDLAAMVMRRQFDWPGKHPADPAALDAAKNYRNDGYAILPNSFTAEQATEIQDYFIARPGYNRHVPDSCPDQIRRYVGYGADQHSFCSYPFSDIVLAPHLLEAVVNPRIAEIGWHAFGAIPRLWKIFTHWDLPGSKFLAGHDTSIGHYHRDLNDVGMMWLYIYLTDVDNDCGPHGLVPGSHLVDNVSKWFQEARDLRVDTRHGNRHLTVDDFFDGYGYQVQLEVKEAMFADREKVFTGPAGTTFISNGFGYHRIVSPQSKRRLLCAARYYLSRPGQLESPYRDTDKVPYHLVKDRIGDSEIIREMTSSVVDWSSPRSSVQVSKPKPGKDKKYFLIISNGRSGSTWLSTLLGNLKGVKTDYEYRWSLPPGCPWNPIHYVIPRHQATVVESLDNFAKDAHIVGSKLTFSLDWTQPQNVFEKINNYFDEQLTYLFLTRPYIETLASFLLRGPVHELEHSKIESGHKNVMLNELQKNFDRPDVSQRKLFGDEWDVLHALRMLVNNDIIGFGICQRFPNRIHIPYDRILTDFKKVVDAIGWQGDAQELSRVIDNPVVKKLPVLDYGSFPQSKLFIEYANRLDATLHKAINEEWSVEKLRSMQAEILDALSADLGREVKSAAA